MRSIRWLVVAAATAVACIPAPAARADHSVVDLVSTGPAVQPCTGFCGSGELNDTSDDGRVVVFTTWEALTADDTNGTHDLYRRAGSAITRIGPVVSQYNSRISDDGATTVFASPDPLLPSDADSKADVYEHTSAGLRLLSSGPGESGPSQDVSFVGMTDDATHVFMMTTQSLVSGDTDSEWDLYERTGSSLELVSEGGNGATQPWSLSFHEAVASGSKVFFVASSDLLPSDTNGLPDLYMRAAGQLSVVSPPGAQGIDGSFAFSLDGTRYVVTTPYHVPPEDDDTAACGDNDGDVWDCSDVFTYDIGSPAATWLSDIDCCSDVSLRAFSADLASLFVTRSATGGLYEIQSTGRTFIADGVDYVLLSDDGTHLFFRTRSRLVAQDTDTDFDLYERAGGVLRLASTGPSDTNASGNIWENIPLGASADGSAVFFQTAKALVPQDTNSLLDIYERSGGTTTLLSKGPSGQGSSLVSTFPTNEVAVSDDGTRVYFHTYQRLVPHDTDQDRDLYAARLADITGHARPKGATPFRVPLVPAAKPCTSPNREHGPPLAFGSCAPVQPESPSIAVSQGDARLRSVGFVRMDVGAGAPGGPDDTDVGIRFSITNVMNLGDFSDYTGELRASAAVSLTDRSPTVPATTPFTFAFDVSCAATADTFLGATCALNTTADAVLPGAAPEGTRAVWALDRFQVHDGGPDGDADTAADNALFATQGVFVP